MSKELVTNKEDILGAIFLASQIKNDQDYKDYFNLGDTRAFERLEILSEEKFQKISKSTFWRLFKIKEGKQISFDKLNAIVSWYTKKEYQTFKSYVEANKHKIISANLISDEELVKSQQKKSVKNKTFTINEEKEVYGVKPKPVKKDKEEKLYFTGIIGLLVTVIVIAAFYFDTEKSKQPNTKIDQINIHNNDFRQITPTKETQFFSKENEEPLVWYAGYNNQLDFFNGKGMHPVSGEQLQPITKEMVRTYFIEKIPLEQNINTKTPTVVSVEKNIRTSSSIFNQSVINTAKNKEISVFIFYPNYKIDHTFTNYLKKELQSKKYHVTAPLILPSKLSTKIVERILAQDFSYFEEDLKKYTDYICTGSIEYKFIEETNSVDLVVCKLQIKYAIISITTGETIENYSNVINGNGFSKISAKNNAFKKFKL